MYGTHGAALVMDSLLVDYEESDNCNTWAQSAQKIAVAVQAQLLAMAVTNDTPNGRSDLQHYLDNGFVSLEANDKSATYTLAYAYDDYILGAISTKLESLNMSIIDHEEVTAALARGSNFANVFSKENSFFCPRSNNGTDGNGPLVCPKNPAAPLIDKTWYTEGDAYHYAYYCFQDIPGLISLYDSPEAFDEALLSIFVKSLDHPFGEPIPNEYYWAGNEHDNLYPWFFNFGPNCSHTQEWTRKITHLHYNTSPRGLPGNDDYGAMSSWVLWASLGLHPLPGSSLFFVGSPRVSKATIYLTQLLEDAVDNGDVALQIVTYDNSDVNVFVKALYVDGVEVNTPFLERSQIEQGALLEFYMTSDPMEGGLC
jgi:putative alpha-1,2-mannosidase